MTKTEEPLLVETRSPAKRKPGKWRIANIVDGRALRVKLTAAAQDNLGDDAAARKAALDHLHAALFRGRLIAQERLQQGADGLDTARLLAAVQDEVISALYDFTTVHIFRASNPTEAERLSVIATGGYGRAVMAPSSDTDLLFLRSYKASPHTESVIEFMMYALWDMGLKVGNAFRTPQECVRLALEDVTIKTSLLDARYVCGDEALAQEMQTLFDKEVVKGQDAQFIDDKLAERDARHERQGDARYVVEPNVKEGKGGLRDLQTLYWIVKHMEGGTSLESVLSAGLFTPHERALFMRAGAFLWTVRCHLHFVTGRPEERLSFDLQPEIASRMGYKDRAGQLGVERFMKRYFLAAKDVGGLTRIVAAKLEAQQKKKPEGLRRFLPAKAAVRLDDEGFTLDAGRISIASEETFKDDPLNMLRLFLIAQREGKDVHPDAVVGVARNLKTLRPNMRALPETQDLLQDAVLKGDRPGLVLRRMNEVGVLGRALPEFGGIVGQTQFNMYHHYTVDEHTIRAVEAMSDMEHERGEPVVLASELFPLVEHRRALYFAMLLHDTGKGKGDQQIEGYTTSTRACRRLGMPKEEVELVGWLVGHHLEMSETAQKRDISDPRTVASFAELVGSLERLRLLYILTVADIMAVGPGVWNAWKGQLLADLYHNAAAALRGGRTDEGAVLAGLEARAEKRRRDVVDQLGTIPSIMLEMERAYWTGSDIEELLWHASVLGENDTVARARVMRDGAAVSLLVSGKDRRGLFASLAGTLANLGANIVSAQVFTNRSGRIVDIFMLQDARGQPFAESDRLRLEAMEDACLEALKGKDVQADIKIRNSQRQAAFVVRPFVQIWNDLSADFTVVDIGGRDRPGLLHDVASGMAEEKLSIHSAHVGSYGERVFDAFYIRTVRGSKLRTKAGMDDLQVRIMEILMRAEPEAPETPARTLKRSRAVDSF
jgi:[protein-PII] uridylyltransferase